jgi:hypothetical protein
LQGHLPWEPSHELLGYCSSASSARKNATRTS